MRKSLPFWITLAVGIVVLAFSALLLVDYVKPHPVFCDPEGGCGALKNTSIAYPFGLPMPVFGLSGVLAVVLASLVSGRVARILQAVLACLGALVAGLLLYVQARLGTFCPYCVVVDVGVLILAVLSVARAFVAWDPVRKKGVTLGASVAITLAVVVPIAVGAVKKPIPVEVPAAIAAEIRATPRGKITVVDFVDFECPYCRMNHEELAPILAAEAGRVRLVRVHVPLAIHPHAKDAARASICAERMNQGDAVSDALFAADTEELTPDGTVRIAEKLGLDPERFRSCLTSPEVDARLDADKQKWKDIHGQGLPTLWIGENKLEGAQDRATLRAAFDEAASTL